MERQHPLWHEAAAAVQSEVDADLRGEAFEVFVAETGRRRLVDRVDATGSAMTRVTVRSGIALRGLLRPLDPPVDGHLALGDGTDRITLVPISAVVMVTGTSTSTGAGGGSRPRSLSSVLRGAWASGEPVGALLSTGQRLAGDVAQVGADHVDLRTRDGVVTVGHAGVDAWFLDQSVAY